jgi:uncharacterized protein (DUF1800 family)
VAAEGVLRWIDHQLDGRSEEPGLARRLRTFPILRTPAAELADAAMNAARARRDGERMPNPLRDLNAQLTQATLVRAVTAKSQLREVLADFWFNHFNVSAGKRPAAPFVPAYLEHTIRPHTLGRFEDLLFAVARSPAMLIYLDNAQSVAAGSMPRRSGPRAPKGLNENYARELLELHTLGVDGGYTQADVIAVARILTGWSVDRRTGKFIFRPQVHDRGTKTALGTRFSARGEAEGEQLLRLLAAHPATAHHITTKLCARFVADQPPDGCIDAGVRAWQRTKGDLREVVRAIVLGPEFWSPTYARTKIKTPLEFVASAVRALGGDPDTTTRLARVLGRLGQPLFLESSPAGYPERQEGWTNAGALFDRMNLAVAIAAGQLPGVQINLDDIVAAAGDTKQLIAALDTAILGGTMTARTRAVLHDELRDVRAAGTARALAVGLVLGGPEFQRQ